MSRRVAYLGDGLYAEFVTETLTLWLKANSLSDPTDQVALEPAVLDSLLNFMGANEKYDELLGEVARLTALVEKLQAERLDNLADNAAELDQQERDTLRQPAPTLTQEQITETVVQVQDRRR